MALTGLIGPMLMPRRFRKTTIAVEFCYRRKKAHPQEDIFWLHGNTEQTFKTSYLELGRKAGLPGADDEEGRLDSVKTWLERTSSREWLLVIDNLDDIDLRVNKYIPVGRGTILFTTRDKRLIGHEGYLSPNEGVEIAVMSDQEASETFRTLLGLDARVQPHPDSDREASATFENLQELGASVQTYPDGVVSEARQLLVHFDNLPLAIAQAAAYIRETGMTLLEYLKIFKECERNQQRLLNEGVRTITIGDNTDLAGSARAVMTTWKITVDQIERTSPDSIRLLEILSFLGNEEIPQELMNGIPFLQNDLFLLHKTVKPLLSFALLYRLETSNYRIHRLVAASIRAQSEQQNKEKHLETAVKLILQKLPKDARVAMQKCRQLLPHAMAALEYTAVGHRSPDFELHCDLMHDVGSALRDMGNYRGALEWYQRALDGYEKTLGKDHPSTLDTVHNMASVFDNQGEYEKALEWYQRALDGREKTLGKDHPSTLNTVHAMASVFDNQGEYEKALEWYQRALDGWEKTLGKDHLSTLDTVNNMAIVFDKRGEYEKALEWYQRGLDGREKTLEKDHPSILDTVHNMAIVFYNQGEYEKALEWYQRALDGKEKMLGKDHPSTLDTVNNMAIVFQSQGEYEKALEWYQRALDGKEKTLGEDHHSTLDTVNNMAVVFNNQGEYEKALEWYQRALDGCEKTLGEDHPSTLDTVHNMASVFDNQGEYEKALEWFQRALDGREKMLGKDHPDTLDTVNNMAVVFDNQGEYEKALEWYQRALDGREKTLGKDHPSTLDTVHNMASVFDNQGEYEKDGQLDCELVGRSSTKGQVV
jgi:tetratricopeptide (TPR) repeat protein